MEEDIDAVEVDDLVELLLLTIRKRARGPMAADMGNTGGELEASSGFSSY